MRIITKRWQSLFSFHLRDESDSDFTRFDSIGLSLIAVVGWRRDAQHSSHSREKKLAIGMPPFSSIFFAR